MTRITVPQLDVNLVDVTVLGWKHRVGEEVSQGEPLVEVSTDKAAFEIESPASGTLLAVYAAPKSVVPAAYVLGLIGAAGEQDPLAEAENARLTGKGCSCSGQAACGASADVARAARVRATPRARRLAQEAGWDLADIQARTGVEVIDEAALDVYRKRLSGG